jgi:hypothetical protein
MNGTGNAFLSSYGAVHEIDLEVIPFTGFMTKYIDPEASYLNTLRAPAV